MSATSRFLGAAVLFAFASSLQAKDETKACVEALKIAAKSEYKFETDEALDTALYDAFCDVVKNKKESKSKPEAGLLYGALSLKLSNDQSELANFERTYCRDTRSKLSFKSAYRVWASVVHGDPLTKFNGCMKIAMQAAASRGVGSEVKHTDACHSVAEVWYRPTGEGPKVAKVNTVHPYNVQCSKVPKQLLANAQTFECRRTSWEAGSLTMGTSQEPVEIEFPAIEPPAAPTPPKLLQADQLPKSFIVQRAKYEPGVHCVQDGRLCDGPMSLGVGAKVLSVTWSCVGAPSSKGDDLCGWSYGNRSAGSRAANWQQVGDGELRWFRYWDGDASNATVETYTVVYTAPHVDSAEESAQRANYAAELKKHKALVENGPCRSAQATPAKKVSRANP